MSSVGGHEEKESNEDIIDVDVDEGINDDDVNQDDEEEKNQEEELMVMMMQSWILNGIVQTQVLVLRMTWIMKKSSFNTMMMKLVHVHSHAHTMLMSIMMKMKTK